VAKAIKVLPPEFKERRGFIERFEREAQVMANLEHPHIIKVDDFRETEGKLWLRMEPPVHGKNSILIWVY